MQESKVFKKEINKLAGTLIGYEVMMTGMAMVCVLIYSVLYTIIHLSKTSGLTDEVYDSLYKAVSESGIPIIIGVAAGLIFIIIYRKKQLFTYDLKTINCKMTSNAFIKIFLCFMAVQLVFSVSNLLLEGVLNYFGYSMQTQIETATSAGTTFSMFLYVSFIGPIVEELVFRGAVLRSLESHGKVFAIVISSILFGLIHANLSQGIFAAVLGLVLGYVAIQYSLKWAILLHIINNFVFGQVLQYLIKDLSPNVQSAITYGILIPIFIGGLIVLLRNKTKIKDFLTANRTEKGLYKQAFTSFWLFVFIAVNLLFAISGIEKLN